MSRIRRAKDINKNFNENCPNDKYICPHLLKPDDEPTQFVGLGIRCFITFIGWFVLGFKMEGKAVFNSLFLYFIPLLMDYLRFRPINKRRCLLRIFGKTFSIIFLIIAFLGFIGIFEATVINSVTMIKVSADFIAFHFINIKFIWLWRVIGIAPFITIFDYFAYRTPAEQIIVSKACIA